MVRLTEDFQNNASPPPRPSLGTIHLWSQSMLRKTVSSLTLSINVSAINTTDRSFAWIIYPNSFLVRRFPSLQQFHTRIFMILGKTGFQPPPLKEIKLHHSSKTASFLQVNSEWSTTWERNLLHPLTFPNFAWALSPVRSLTSWVHVFCVCCFCGELDISDSCISLDTCWVGVLMELKSDGFEIWGRMDLVSNESLSLTLESKVLVMKAIS